MSIKSKKNRLLYILISLLLLIIASVLSVRVGTLSFLGHEIWDGLLNRGDGTAVHHVINNIRLPRTIIAALVGSNLAIAGALLQGVLRNPLASPQIIGVNSGAGLGAIAIMVLLPASASMIPVAAFAAAMLTALTVYALSAKKGAGSGVTVILAGVAISAMLHALTSGLMIIYSDTLEVTYSWLLGGLSGRSWSHLRLLWPYTLIGIMLALYLSPKMNLLLLGDEVGESLGLSVVWYRLIIIACAAFLASSAVSVAGTVGFVGLVAPHTARLLAGNDYRYLTIFSAVLGALLLVLADTAARIVFQPLEIPVGIVTAAIGAPFFLWLLFEKKNDF